MNPHIVPRKTEAAHQLLAASRQALPAGLRMLLITVDGRKNLAALQQVAEGLGLQPQQAFGRLESEGLITGAGQAPATAQQAGEASAQRLVRAKFFAMDLAARMLAGRDERLREGARGVDSETSFQAWLEECAAEITQRASAERAALFKARVAAV